MSFQGDVGGIGLAELLQSIARGSREGVLVLTSRSGLHATLGLQGGVLYLLPEREEDPQRWKDLGRQAWIHKLDPRIDAVRIAEIARAHRIENVYRLLDSEGVHFRFEPGPLPAPGDTSGSSDAATPKRMPQVHCEGVSVEYMLLEFARLTDELGGVAGFLGFSNHRVPRILDQGRVPDDGSSLWAEIDGVSSVAEISDRLGWPLRQTRLAIANGLQAGTLRFSAPREVLVLAQKELSQGHLTRAASRLTAWIQVSPAGPIGDGDAALLDAEWRAERMPALLNQMPTREARILLRRLDHALGDPTKALRHWREFARLHRHDRIAVMHRIACEQRTGDEEDVTPLRELLDGARNLRESDHPRRAAALLRLAAAQLPTSTAARLELGLGMLAADLVEEAAPWILEAAQTLVDDGAAEKVVTPLRTLLDADPSCRDARRLLSQARNQTLRRQLVRKHSLIGAATLVAISLGAWVQIELERRNDAKLAEISSLLDDPATAQERLDQYFSEDDSERVASLREAILERRRAADVAQRTEWHDMYREAQLECTLGDPMVGLRRALDLPPHPELPTIDEPWPLVADLFNGMAARLERELQTLGETALDDPEQVHGEEQLDTAIASLKGEVGKDAHELEIDDFHARLDAIHEEIGRRRSQRSEMLAARERLDLVTRQDLMLAAARAHDQAGDLGRAIVVYDRLLETDESGRLAKILAAEIGSIRERHETLARARTLAEQGDHDAARRVLDEGLDDPRVVVLPWKLETFPPGAIAHMPDGSMHVTPFVLETRPDQRLTIRLEYDDYEELELAVDEPADRYVWLSRKVERQWKTAGRVESPPVPAGPDHVVCDRAGRIARIGSDGKAVWERELGSLGGIARAPVFLPQKPGHLLFVTEDGEAWIVEAKAGQVEGPYRLGAAPVEGPYPTAKGVLARLDDGRTILWERRIEPRTVGANELLAERDGGSRDSGLIDARAGSTAGLEVLRKVGEDAATLDSPWTPWSVTVQPEAYFVRRGEEEEGAFAVRREGEWSFVAWEAPHARLASGRLWISDGAGLRSFVP